METDEIGVFRNKSLNISKLFEFNFSMLLMLGFTCSVHHQ